MTYLYVIWLKHVYLRIIFLKMTKTELFNKGLQDSASIFKALGHPARLAILKHLSDIKVCISGDISDELPLSRTTVNQHLAILKNQVALLLLNNSARRIKTGWTTMPCS